MGQPHRKQSATDRTFNLLSFVAGMLGVLVLGGLLFLFLFTGASWATPIGIPLLAVVGGLIWLAPIFVARSRNAPNRGPIVVITLFLGWSLVGWVVALAMAFADPRPTRSA